ncbi:MAG: photosystem P840 reaction-center cytochrome c-551, partial [Rhizobacter sp.]|nr:photosystem P840 reaction-center cytochrome c-551 [Chlorobiales bacterium]
MAILGWFALMIGASLTVVGMGKLSQRISSSWFLGILVGFLGLAALFSLFVCTAFGPMRNTTDNKRPPRTVQQLDNPESAESAPPAPAGGTTVTVLTASSTAAKDKFEKFAASLDVPEEYKTFNEKTYASESKVYEAISAMLNSVDKTTGKKPEVSEVEVFEMTQYLAAEARVAGQKREALSAAEAERIKVDEASRLAAAQKTALPAMPMPSVPATGEPITPAPG